MSFYPWSLFNGIWLFHLSEGLRPETNVTALTYLRNNICFLCNHVIITIPNSTIIILLWPPTFVHFNFGLVVNNYTYCAKKYNVKVDKWSKEAKIEVLSDNEDTIDLAIIPTEIDEFTNEEHIDEDLITDKPLFFSLNWYLLVAILGDKEIKELGWWYKWYKAINKWIQSKT